MNGWPIPRQNKSGLLYLHKTNMGKGHLDFGQLQWSSVENRLLSSLWRTCLLVCARTQYWHLWFREPSIDRKPNSPSGYVCMSACVFCCLGSVLFAKVIPMSSLPLSLTLTTDGNRYGYYVLERYRRNDDTKGFVRMMSLWGCILWILKERGHLKRLYPNALGQRTWLQTSIRIAVFYYLVLSTFFNCGLSCQWKVSVSWYCMCLLRVPFTFPG